MFIIVNSYAFELLDVYYFVLFIKRQPFNITLPLPKIERILKKTDFYTANFKILLLFYYY